MNRCPLKRIIISGLLLMCILTAACAASTTSAGVIGLYIAGNMPSASSFCPTLSLHEDGTFEFCASYHATYTGDYTVVQTVVKLFVAADEHAKEEPLATWILKSAEKLVFDEGDVPGIHTDRIFTKAAEAADFLP